MDLFQLERGDVVVIKLSTAPGQEAVDGINRMFPDNKVLIIDGSVHTEVIRQPPPPEELVEIEGEEPEDEPVG